MLLFFPGFCLWGDEEWNQQMKVWSNQQSSLNEWKEKATGTQEGLQGRMPWGLWVCHFILPPERRKSHPEMMTSQPTLDWLKVRFICTRHNQSACIQHNWSELRSVSLSVLFEWLSLELFFFLKFRRVLKLIGVLNPAYLPLLTASVALKMATAVRLPVCDLQ